jgi:hypothetical protein
MELCTRMFTKNKNVTNFPNKSVPDFTPDPENSSINGSSKAVLNQTAHKVSVDKSWLSEPVLRTMSFWYGSGSRDPYF